MSDWRVHYSTGEMQDFERYKPRHAADWTPVDDSFVERHRRRVLLDLMTLEETRRTFGLGDSFVETR